MPRNRLSSRILFMAALGLLITLTPAHTQKPGNHSSERIASVAAYRLSNTESITLSTPHFFVSEKSKAQLVVLNNFSEPLPIEVIGLAAGGNQVLLGAWTVDPRTFLRLDLDEVLGASVKSFAGEGLQIRYQGDSLMMSAWLVMEHGKRSVEWSLVLPEKSLGMSSYSFWDATPDTDGMKEPSYYLLNTGVAPVHYQVRWGDERGELASRRGTIAPGARNRIVPRFRAAPMARGWLRLSHDGALGSVVGLGLLTNEVQPYLKAAQQELLGVLEFHHDVSRSASEYASLGVTVARAPAKGGTYITIHNPTDRAQSALIEVLEFTDGTAVAWLERELAPREVSTVPLESLLERPAGPSGLGEVRLRVTGQHGPIQVRAKTLHPDSTLSDVTFFDVEHAHWSGSYPVPSLADFDVANTMVNVGREPAFIGAQVFWEGGTYVLPRIEIEPGHAHRIDLTSIAANREPDRLGRLLDPELHQGFLQWVSRGGSHSVIARTEAAAAGHTDAFGFNCTLCCWHNSFGSIEPGSVTFNAGSSAGFEATEYIDTCTGTLGPYFAYPISTSYSSPLTWDGHTVSASDVTNQTVSFQFSGEIAPFSTPPCPNPSIVSLPGSGTAVANVELNVYYGYPQDGGASCVYTRCKVDGGSLPQNCSIDTQGTITRSKTQGGNCNPGYRKAVTVRTDGAGNKTCTENSESIVNQSTMNQKCP